MAVSMTDEEVLENLYPLVQWRVPLLVKRKDGSESGYACRFCIGMKGLSAWQDTPLPEDPSEVMRHIALEHTRRR